MSVPVPTASLKGKVALVTGGGRGVGAAICKELGKRGARVIVNYVHSKAPAEEVCRTIEGYGSEAVCFQADVSNVSEIDKLFQEAKKVWGKINLVMSNSGIESWDKTEEITQQKFDHVFSINARAQFFVAQAAWKYMEDNGHVVLTSSISGGAMGIHDHALYNSSKMAVKGMVKAFATDFGKRGITVNGIAPGGIKTDMFTEHAWRYLPNAKPDMPVGDIEKILADSCPLGRCAVPEDIARVVAFLMTDDAGWVNGEILTLSGGSAL